MRFIGLIVMCAWMQIMPVGTAAGAVTVSSGDTAGYESVYVPEVVGMDVEEAIETLEMVVLPDGTNIEVIKAYEYSEDMEEDKVFVQTPVGEVRTDVARQVTIYISLGEEPDELLSDSVQEVNALSTFGIAAYANAEVSSTEYKLGVDWDSLPCSYEYNWDNSPNCWYWGVWVDGVCYKTPVGTYNTDVRHLMQLYCDGTYVYLHMIMSRDYYAKFNSDDYQFWIDGNMAAFKVEYMEGGKIDTSDMAPGTYQVQVIHRNTPVSDGKVADSLAYFTRKEGDVNAEIELRIPLTAMVEQNPNIDPANMGTIEFYTPNLMYRRIMASGASTFPFASAGLALLLVPGSTVLLKKRHDRKKEKAKDEQSV